MTQHTPLYDVCILGLGPVGAISGACFAKQGFNVVGVDIDPARVTCFQNGTAAFVEPGMNELVRDVQKAGTFHATLDAAHAIANARIIMIAVGTPTPPDTGKPDLSFLDQVSETIGKSLAQGTPWQPVVVLRSTVPPGTLRHRLAPIIEQHSGLKSGKGFHIASNPEFLREGSAIRDFFDTGRIVIGADSQDAYLAIETIYRDVNGKRLHTSVESAEFAKYVDNTWHALKVGFANEIGRVVKSFGGNVQETTEIFLSDTTLNISPAYLRPGFAFGGSCLPKDVRGLSHFAETHGATVPIIRSILPSNYAHIKSGIEAILANEAKRVGILGVAFKEDIDDLRESPACIIASELKNRGISVVAHDMAYKQGDQIGLPQSSETLEIVPLEQLAEGSDTIVVFHKKDMYLQLAEQRAGLGAAIVNLTTP